MNRFRDKTLRSEYDACIKMFETKHRNLFIDGNPHRGNSIASHFWAGYEGQNSGLYNFSERSSRNSPAYAHYRAGQDCLKSTNNK